MNSMHNSFSGPGGYSGAYPGYVPPPPSALPYYNGYPGEINQGANPYYGKPGSSSVPPGYSSGMAAYNSSMYYQQYGLGYQYGYNKYSLGSSLGYSSEIPTGPSIHAPSIGTLQAPTTDLGLTGSMFSKNNKYNTTQNSAAPHSSGLNLNHGANTTMLSPAGTPNTPSPGPHTLPGSLRGPGATPSPPVDASEAKKDLEKMRRCQVCGQVFRLMSECLAHMKAVHEAPLSVYSLQHTAGGHVTQTLSSASGLPPHSLSGSLVPPTSRHTSMGTPDSPLMALERMGWGEKQNIISSLQSSSSPLASPFTPVSTLSTTSQHLPTGSHPHHQTSNINQPQTSAQVYQAHQHNIPGQHQSPLLQSPVQHHSPSSMHQSPVRHPSPVRHASPAPQFLNVSQHSGVASNHGSPVVSDSNIPDTAFSQPSAVHSSIMASSISTDSPRSSLNATEDSQCHSIKHRKASLYSVSSIIGETKEVFQEVKPIVESQDHDLKQDKIETHETQVPTENKDSEIHHLHEEVKESCEDINNDNQYEKQNYESKDKILTVKSAVSETQTDLAIVEQSSPAYVADSISMKKGEEEEGEEEEEEEEEEEVVEEEPAEYQDTLEATDNSLQSSLSEGKNESLDLTKDHSEIIDENQEKKELIEPQESDLSNDNIDSQDKFSTDEKPYTELLSSVKEEQAPNDSLKTNFDKDENDEKDLKEESKDIETTEDQQLPKSPEQCLKQELIPSTENQQQAQVEQSLPTPPPLQAPMQQQQQQTSQHQPAQQSMQHQHSSPPVGMYHSQSNIKQQPSYSGWPMSMGPSYTGQYPYPCPQGTNPQPNPQQLPPNAISGSSMCPKPHGYAMHTRFPSQYHQPGVNPGGPPFPHDHHARGPGPHNFMQGHPQGNWFPSNPRPDTKAMWSNWSNQTGQPYPQGFYGYPGASQSQGQKMHHHQQQPPPAHVHPPQVPHMHNMQHPHMTPQPPPSQIPKAPQISQQQFQQQQAQQMQQASLPHQQVHQQTVNQQRQAAGVSLSPHDTQRDHTQSHASLLSPGRQHERSCHTPQAMPDQQSSDVSIAPPSIHVEKSVKQVTASTDPSNSLDKATETSHLQCSISITSTSVKKGGHHKIGPKSKTLAAKQYRQLEDLDNYKCSITVQEHGSVNGYTSQSSGSSTGGRQSCDSSDSELTADDSPTFTLLKPAKRKHINAGRSGGVFIGPKRIKLAMQVRERQQRRHRHRQEQMRQTELEEQLLAQRAEMATEQHGALANILLQSSILLADNKVEESNSVEECIASIKAGRTSGNALDTDNDRPGYSTLSNGSNSGGIKKPGRRSQTKVFHNENSVIIKDVAPSPPLRKLRAKDFKWSHYIKSMRYWCNDCGQGFKNQREANSHSEERCKWNCLYMLECYVVVKDIQTHHEYGPKVQELLEEYQVDGAHHCITCAETIARKADFLVHVDTHKDFMPWECTICGTRFKIRGSLKEHLRYTHMKGRVPCLKCNKVFPTSTLLRQHVKVHTQHYKYKSAKNREEELRAAMEATAGALEVPIGTTTPEDNEKLSHEANEYRSWCKLMEMNALKNLSTPGTLGGIGDDEDDDGRVIDMDGNASGEEGGISMSTGIIGESGYSEMQRRNCDTKLEMSS